MGRSFTFYFNLFLVVHHILLVKQVTKASSGLRGKELNTSLNMARVCTRREVMHPSLESYVLYMQFVRYNPVP